MLGTFGEVGKIPELKKRVLFTLAMIAVYRFGVYVSTPGIDVEALRRSMEGGMGSLFGFINMFSGGALEHFSIFSLGIMPYISMSIIVQVLTPNIPALEALKKEGESGQRVLTRYTRLGTIVLALIQGYFISVGLEGQGVAAAPGMMFKIQTMLTLCAGTAFMMWLGEQITERGLGNGISILIMAGIVARMPSVFYQTLLESRTGQIAPLAVIIILLFCVLTIAGIVYVERCFRRIPIHYPRRLVGKNMAQAQTQYMPLKVNMTGVIPPIFASAFLIVPATIATFSKNETMQEIMVYLSPGKLVYDIVFVALIVGFAFFYSSIMFNPTEIAENLKKRGGFIPTVRPGKPTADYLYTILNRLTFIGAVYISIVCIVPQFFYLNLGAMGFASVFGGTAVLIVVGVTLDTASQIESHVVARNYESFMNRSSKVRGGMGSMSQMRQRLLRR